MKLSYRLIKLARILKDSSGNSKFKAIIHLLGKGKSPQEIQTELGVTSKTIGEVMSWLNNPNRAPYLNKSIPIEPEESIEKSILRLRAKQVDPEVISEQLGIEIDHIKDFLKEIRNRFEEDGENVVPEIAEEYDIEEDLIRDLFSEEEI